MRPDTTLGALGVTLGAGVLGVVWGANTLSPGALVALYVALSVPYALFLWRLHHTSFDPRLLFGVLALGLVMRLGALPAAPLLSDDIFRYVWDGRVALAGINPFQYAPNDPALSALRDGVVWPYINHPKISTIYPPMAQAMFWLNALLGGGVSALKGLFVGFELGCVGLGAWMLGKLGWTKRARLSALALYFLNPLVVLETAWSGHLDVLAFLPLALGILWFAKAQRHVAVLAGVLIGWSIGAKLLGVILLPLCWLMPRGEKTYWEATKRRLGMTLVAGGLVALSFVPFLDAGDQLTSGFRTYAASWRNNDGPFRVIMNSSRRAILEMSSPSMRHPKPQDKVQVLLRYESLEPLFLERGWTKEWQGKTLPDTTFTDDQIAQACAKFIVAGLMALLLLWCLIVTRDPLYASGLLLSAFFLLSPTVFPWYVAWLVPLAALLYPSHRHLTLTILVFCAGVPLAYLAWVSSKGGGPWEVPLWALAVEFGAVMVAWCWFAFAHSPTDGDVESKGP